MLDKKLVPPPTTLAPTLRILRDPTANKSTLIILVLLVASLILIEVFNRY